MPTGPQVYRIRGLDCAEEVAALKRDLGPLVGGHANLEFDVLCGKLTVAAAVEMPSPGVVRAAVARAGLRAEHWGVGEAVRQARLAQLDKDTGEWTYHIGGVLIARYHPWKHYLTIHTENSETPQAICRWAENGSLTLDPAGAMPTAVEQGACNALLHELARRFPVTETAKVNTSPRPATP